MEEAFQRERREEIRRRREQEQMRRQNQLAEQQQENQMNIYQTANQWEELSDHQNMIDEDQIEPDYFIDRAPDATYIPNEKGHEKATQIFDGDYDLFDFEQEVEPVLQVLVGKSIEHARIEVIEEYEAMLLKEHKIKFLQIKEAELMET